MPTTTALSYASVITGSMVISLGMVLQKKGVHWLALLRAGNPDFRRLRKLWIAGLVLNNMLAIFYYFGLRGLQASVVGAMTRVAPALYGAQIIWPVVSSYLIFDIPVVGTQVAAFACVVLSVVMIQR